MSKDEPKIVFPTGKFTLENIKTGEEMTFEITHEHMHEAMPWAYAALHDVTDACPCAGCAMAVARVIAAAMITARRTVN